MALKKFLLATVIVIGCSFCGCREPETPNCRALFEKYYAANVQMCMAVLPSGLDSVATRQKCECMLNKLYEIDSTFVLMEGKKLEEFIRSNSGVIQKCDSIR